VSYLPPLCWSKEAVLIVRSIGRCPGGRDLVDHRPAGHRLVGRHLADRRPADHHLVFLPRGALSRDLVVRLVAQRLSVSVGLDLVLCS